MGNLACLWNRPRLERYVDAALGSHAARSVESHLRRCDGCRHETEQLKRFRVLVHAAVPDPAEPEWSGFWPAIHARIRTEAVRPVRDPWWLPVWKPVWGHPRLAFGSAVALVLALVFSLWPGGESNLPAAWAGPVVVQDVGTPDPDRSVMVYSSPDHGLTVIWVFSPDAANDES